MFSSCNGPSRRSGTPYQRLNNFYHLERQSNTQDIASVRCNVLMNFNLMINYPNLVLHELALSLLNSLVEFVADQLNNLSEIILDECLMQVKDCYQQLKNHILFDNYPEIAFTLVEFDPLTSIAQIERSFLRNNSFPEGLLNLLSILPKSDLHSYFSDKSLQILKSYGIDTSISPSVFDKLNLTVDKFLQAKRIPPIDLLHLVTNSQLEKLQLAWGIRTVRHLNECRSDFLFRILYDHFINNDDLENLNNNDSNVEILFNLAICYKHGIGTGENNEESMRLFRRCASAGYKPAMSIVVLGNITKFIELNLSINDKITRLEEALSLDEMNVDAIRLLARYYSQLFIISCGIKEKNSNVRNKDALNEEDHESKNDSRDIHIISRNSEYWFDKAACLGNKGAFEYASILERGRVFPKDINLAIHYYECSAILGNANAAFNLASIYEKNENHTKATFWYKKAMNLGSELATVFLFNRYCYMNFDQILSHGIFLISRNDIKDIIKNFMKITRLNTYKYERQLREFVRKHPELRRIIRECELASYAYKLAVIPSEIRKNQGLISQRHIEHIDNNDLETKDLLTEVRLTQQFLSEDIVFDDNLFFILMGNGSNSRQLIPFETVVKMFENSNDDYGDEFRNPDNGQIMKFVALRNLS